MARESSKGIARNIVSEVYRTFNGLGQLTAEYQSHSGGVNTSTSPKVQYAYSEMPSGADYSRLTAVILRASRRRAAVVLSPFMPTSHKRRVSVGR
jgi:hypothetical protein